MNEAAARFRPVSQKMKVEVINPPKSVARAPFRAADVIATGSSNMVLFEAQTHLAAAWLGARCGTDLDNIYDQVCVDARQQDQIVRELKAAGFQVITQKM